MIPITDGKLPGLSFIIIKASCHNQPGASARFPERRFNVPQYRHRPNPHAPLTIGPDSGEAPTAPNTWTHNFAHTPAPGGTKFLILHFINASLPAANRLEVDLGYGTDVFSSADGADFWTRPVNVHVLPGGNVPIRYVTDGAAGGSVQLDRYGRGESLPGSPGQQQPQPKGSQIEKPAATDCFNLGTRHLSLLLTPNVPWHAAITLLLPAASAGHVVQS